MAAKDVDVMEDYRACLPSDHPVSRDVPTLIYDSKAWVAAEHYDNAKVEIESLRQQLAGAVDALREIVDRAYGVSGATGDDAGYITELGLMAKDALDRLGGR